MVNGEVISVTEVKDDVFSSCMLGKGIAIHPTDGVVVAPLTEKFPLPWREPIMLWVSVLPKALIC